MGKKKRVHAECSMYKCKSVIIPSYQWYLYLMSAVRGRINKPDNSVFETINRITETVLRHCTVKNLVSTDVNYTWHIMSSPCCSEDEA